MGVRELVKRTLIEKENRSYKRRLQKRKTSYGEWAKDLETEQAETLGGTEVLDKAEEAGRDFVVICASRGCLSYHATKNIKCYFDINPKSKILYGDEDVWSGRSQGAGKSEARRNPWFKPDWSPDLLDNCLYLGSLVAVDRELFDRVQAHYDACFPGQGMTVFCKGEMEGVNYQVADQAAYERWLHVCLNLARAYVKGSAAVAHIPAILFHSEDEKEQMKFLEDTSWLKECRNECVLDFGERRVIKRKQERDAGADVLEPVVSIVIPSRDQPEVLEKCLLSCLLAAGIHSRELLSEKDRQGRENWQPHGREELQDKEEMQGRPSTENSLPLEVILVDNGSSQENRVHVEETVSRLSMPLFQIRYLYKPMEFHFSRMCNLGAEQAKGQFLFFLNDDVELCQPGCIEKMAAMAERSFTGAVGMKLLYPDSDRIQHAGITNLPMGPVHKLQFLNDSESYYYGSNKVNRNTMAVTGACLMVEKDKFWEAGGFSEELRVAFNDVDLCFRLYELGYWNVCVNELHAFHHESLSRGTDESAEKLARLLKERDKLYGRHPELQGVDPFYSVYLNREGLDTRIRPACVTSRNRIQQVMQEPGRLDPTGCRRDDCLMVRIEDSRGGKISGYGVVLGDNNACYEYSLLFCEQKKKASAVTDKRSVIQPVADGQRVNSSGNVYKLPLEGQYRPDLEENMPDQVNVALNGFAAELAEGVLPPGYYRLGLAARNRVTGLRLINWSNRYFCVQE